MMVGIGKKRAYGYIGQKERGIFLKKRIFVVLSIEPMALCMLDKYSTTQLQLQLKK
jgi:hypothetical protein